MFPLREEMWDQNPFLPYLETSQRRTFRVREDISSLVEGREGLGDTRLGEEVHPTKSGMNNSPEVQAQGQAAQRRIPTGSRTPGRNTRLHGIKIETRDPIETRTEEEDSQMKIIRRKEERRGGRLIKNMISKTQKRVTLPKNM